MGSRRMRVRVMRMLSMRMEIIRRGTRRQMITSRLIEVKQWIAVGRNDH